MKTGRHYASAPNGIASKTKQNREGEEKRMQAIKKKEGNDMKKIEIRKIIEKEMGVNYDSQIVIDALTIPESFLFSRFQLKKFREYVSRFGLQIKAVEFDGYCWEVIPA